mmetsp:Transcript_9043/g.21649  ORF Transcript_9043/g.21649 Transcript_9043/m.21649 type:complete len:274 (-) Transcript_9043:124-945(-)
MPILVPVNCWTSFVPAPPLPMMPPTRRFGTTQLKAKPRESSVTYEGRPSEIRLNSSTPWVRRLVGYPAGPLLPEIAPGPAILVLAHPSNQLSSCKTCTCLLISSIIISSDSCVPPSETTCSAPGPCPVGSDMEILALLVSRRRLMFVPPLPMMPPTAAFGTSTLSLKSFGDPRLSAAVPCAHSATFAIMILARSKRWVSSGAEAVRMRQSVPGNNSLCSVRLILACVRWRMSAMTAPPFPIIAEAKASGVRNFRTQGIVTRGTPTEEARFVPR